MKQQKKDAAQTAAATQMQEGEDEATDVGQDDEEQLFNEIDQLQQHGINMADITKLKQAGLTTILSILMW